MNKKLKGSLIIVGISIPVLTFLYVVFSFGMHFSGHNTYAESYIVNYPEDKVIEAINKFKANNPQFQVPKVTISKSTFYDFMPDGRDTGISSNWYTVYFYIKKQNSIMYTETSNIVKDKTEFTLVSLNKGLEIGHWKYVNRDLTDEEDEQLKSIFENQILNPIKRELEQQK